MLQRLQRCEAELRQLVPAEGSPALAREQARWFNEDVATVRAALLEPAKDLLAKGAPLRDLTACLEKSVAQLVFWRRVLLDLHGDALGPKPDRSDDYLLRWLTG